MKEIELSTAEEALIELSPVNKLWDGYTKKYTFRGQGNSAWNLLPKALRKETKFNHDFIIDSISKRSNRDQIELEYEAIHEFIEYANLAGFFVANDEKIYMSNESENFIEYHNKIGKGQLP